jgi:hypothetical protein
MAVTGATLSAHPRESDAKAEVSGNVIAQFRNASGSTDG